MTLLVAKVAIPEPLVSALSAIHSVVTLEYATYAARVLWGSVRTVPGVSPP
jgi:hypothetical protein